MSEKLIRREHMQPVSVKGVVIAAGRRLNIGSVSCYLARKAWATVRATFPQGADDHLYLEAFYSPDGDNWDTSTLFSTFLPVSEGNTRQITQCFNCIPEVGYLKFDIYNADDTQVVAVSAWAGVSKWDSKVSKQKGEKIAE